MKIKIYELEREGMDFKSEFNKFNRIMKIFEERKDNSYIKIDLVKNKSKIFICKRFADFTLNKAIMSLEEIKCY